MVGLPIARFAARSPIAAETNETIALLDLTSDAEGSGEVIRPLDTTEWMYVRVERDSPVNCAAMARVEGHLTPALLRAALDRLQAEEPLLAASVQAEGRALLFRRTQNPIPLEIAPRSTDALAVAEAEMNHRYTLSEGPLARATLLEHPEGAELVLSFHHVVADGRALVRLTERVLEIASALDGGRSLGPIEPAKPESVVSLWPDAVAGARGWLATGRFILRVAQLYAGWPAVVKPGPDPSPPTAHRARLVRATLDAASTEALVRRARAENTSVQGALIGALALATHDLLTAEAPHPAGPADPERAPKHRVASTSAVDLRPRLSKAPDSAAGTWASMAWTEHDLGPETTLWPLAREAKSQLASTIDRSEPLVSVCLAGKLMRSAAALERTAVSPFLISNLGRIAETPRDSAFRLADFRFAAPTIPATGNALITAVSTYAGRMHFTFAYPEGRLDDAHARALIRGTLDRLMR